MRDAEPESDLELDSLSPGALALVKVLAKLSVADRRDVLAHRSEELPFSNEDQFQEFVAPEMVRFPHPDCEPDLMMLSTLACI